MAKDKPSFLQNIGDDEEEKEVISVLEDNETPEIEKETQEAKDEVQQQETESKTTQDEETKKETTQEKTTTKEPLPDEKKITTGKGKSKEETPQEKTKEEKPLIMGKYKSVEDLEKAYLELQRAFNRVSNEIKQTQPRKDDELSVFRKFPVIKPNIPDPSRYYFKNENGEDVLDLQAYMRDSFNNFALSVQQSLLGGPLASAVFSLISRAINEEHQSVLSEAKREEEAVRIWDKVQQTYPILSKDERLQRLFEIAIYGEKRKRALEAEQQGKEYVDMTEEDYLKLAGEIVASQPTSSTQPQQEPVEKVRTDAVLTEGGLQLNPEEKEIERDIEEMMATKRKSIF